MLRRTTWVNIDIRKCYEKHHRQLRRFPRRKAVTKFLGYSARHKDTCYECLHGGWNTWTTSNGDIFDNNIPRIELELDIRREGDYRDVDAGFFILEMRLLH